MKRGRKFLADTLEFDFEMLKQEYGEDEEFKKAVIDFLSHLRGKIKEITEKMREYVQFMKLYVRNNTDYYVFSWSSRCSSGSRCYLCLGRFNLHYPNFSLIPKKLIGFRKIKSGKFRVKREEISSFLKFCGLTDKQAKLFLLLEKERDSLIRLYHYIILCLSRLQLLPIEYEWKLVGEIRKGKEPEIRQTSLFMPTLSVYSKRKQDISKFVKLGNWRIFDNPISERVSVGIRQKIVGFDKTLSEYLTNMNEIITFLTEQIQNDIRQIIDKAKQNGVRVSVYGVSCGRLSCITCLGRYPNHYPHFRVWDEDLQKRDKRRTIKDEELPNFLTKLGFNKEYVDEFIQKKELREVLIKIRNSNLLTFHWMGFSSLSKQQEGNKVRQGVTKNEGA